MQANKRLNKPQKRAERTTRATTNKRTNERHKTNEKQVEQAPRHGFDLEGPGCRLPSAATAVPIGADQTI